jgi:hypothetical protein
LALSKGDLTYTLPFGSASIPSRQSLHFSSTEKTANVSAIVAGPAPNAAG